MVARGRFCGVLDCSDDDRAIIVDGVGDAPAESRQGSKALWYAIQPQGLLDEVAGTADDQCCRRS